MAKYNGLINDFSFGRISKRLYGRTDSKNYPNSCETLSNFFPIKQGGAFFRPGTEFITNVSANAHQLIPFVSGNSEQYLIMITTDTGATNNFFIYDRYGTVVYATAIATFLTKEVKYAQANDVMILVTDGTEQPQILTRITTNTFRIYNWEFEATFYGVGYSTNGLFPRQTLTFPFMTRNVTTTTIHVDSLGDEHYTLTASTAIFTENPIGKIYKITSAAGNTYAFKVTAKTSATEVDADNLELLSTYPHESSTKWEESYWGGANGWPSTVAFFENRLVFGGTTKNPDSVYMSMVNNIWHFMERAYDQDATTDASSYKYMANSDEYAQTVRSQVLTPSGYSVDPIQWLFPMDALFIGGVGSEKVVSGGESSLNVTTVKLRTLSYYGSTDAQPSPINDGVAHITNLGKSIRLLFYDPAKEGYNSLDITFHSEDISENLLTHTLGFKSIHLSRDFGCLFCITNGNKLITVTIDNETSMSAWATMFDNDSDILIKSIAILPTTELDIFNQNKARLEYIYLLVSRDNGTTYSIERMQRLYADAGLFGGLVNQPELPYNRYFPWFLDSAVRNSIFTGLKYFTVLSTATDKIAWDYGQGSWNERLSMEKVFPTGTALKIVDKTGTLPTGLTEGIVYYARQTTYNPGSGDLFAMTLYDTFAHAAEGGATGMINVTDITGHTAIEIETVVQARICGLDRFATETIQLWENGVQSDVAVTTLHEANYITLSAATELAIAGLSYSGEIRTVPIELGAQFGTSKDSPKRIHQLVPHFAVAIDPKIGKDNLELETLELEGTDTAFYEGTYKVSFDSGSDEKIQFSIVQDTPNPLVLLSVTAKGVTYDD